MSELLEAPPPPTTHAPSMLCPLRRGVGVGGPGTGWLRFTASAGCAPLEPPAARCRRDDTRGPPGWWGLPGSASRCWGSHTSTPHAARSETSCTEERGHKGHPDKNRGASPKCRLCSEVWVCLPIPHGHLSSSGMLVMLAQELCSGYYQGCWGWPQ